MLNTFDVLEFFWKSIYYLQNGNYPSKHLPQNVDYLTIERFLIQNGANNNRIKSIFRSYNPNWYHPPANRLGNPPARMTPRYGNPAVGVGPQNLYNRINTKRAARDGTFIASELVKFNRTILLQQPDLLVGILNGKVTRSRKEIKCNKAPYAEGISPTHWFNFLNRTGIKPNKICNTQINNSFPCIVNPFGEAFPEKVVLPGSLPSYEAIKEYIFSGGIFVVCGGLPFTYYFDVNSGPPLKDTSILVNNVPVRAQLATINGVPQIQLLGTTLMVNTLLQKDFGVVTLMDNPPSWAGPFNRLTMQTLSAKRYYNSPFLPNLLTIFRPTNPIFSSGAVPIAQSVFQGRIIYPVSFTHYGFGLLLHIGLDLRIGKKQEINFAKQTVLNVLLNYCNFF